MGTIEAVVIVACFVLIAALACFCAMAGYLLAYVGQLVHLVSETKQSIDGLAKVSSDMANSLPPPEVPAGMMGPGFYGPMSVQDGLTRMTPLTHDKH